MNTISLAVAALWAPVADRSPSADPITIEIQTDDADRFADLYKRTGGEPTAAQLQEEYIDRGSYGVSVFTPNRIVNAQHLAKVVAANPETYNRAIHTCLPIVKQTTGELRATYLAFRGLFPNAQLPQIYVVVGGNNSGGTAATGAQVLGLEVLCSIAENPDALREIMRGFYAHETVHVLQGEKWPNSGNILLDSVLQEGAADFIATLVTGRQMDEKRAAWAVPREAELWRQFEADLIVTRKVPWKNLKRGTPAGDAFFRWIANAGDAPAGWPGEAGYWMGQRIWQRWFDKQLDKETALRTMLLLLDPEAIFLGGRLESAEVLRQQ